MNETKDYTSELSVLLHNPRLYWYGFTWSLANVGWSLLFIHTTVPAVDYLFLIYLFGSLYGWLKWLPQKKDIRQKQRVFQERTCPRKRINNWCDYRRRNLINV